MSDTRIEGVLDLSGYLQILRRRWKWALAALLVVMGAAVGLRLLQADSFTAETRVLVAQSEAETVVSREVQNSSFLTRTLANEISLAEGDQVRARVEAAIGGDADVSVSAEGVSDVLRFRAVDPTPTGAAEAANAYAAAYVAEKQAQATASLEEATNLFNEELEDLGVEREELRTEVVELQNQLATASSDARADQLERDIALAESRIASRLSLIDTRINAVAEKVIDLSLSGRLAPLATARIVETAVPPTAPSNTPLSRSIGLGIVAGTIAAMAAALLANNLDSTIDSGDDIRQLFNLPVLGSIPVSDDVSRPALDLQTLEHPESPVGDAYHRVRTALQFSFLSRDVKSVLVTSANPAEGKTTTSINLAGALAAIGSRVILADVDFRRPRLHQVFSIDMVPGLSDHLLEGTPLHELAFTVASANNSLVVLPSGSPPPSPGDLVSTPAFADLVRLAEKEGDIAVLDAPPILPVSDAVALSRLVDAVVITALAGSTSRDDLERTIQTLNQVGAEIAGVVLVGASTSEQYYRYRSDYGRQQSA